MLDRELDKSLDSPRPRMSSRVLDPGILVSTLDTPLLQRGDSAWTELLSKTSKA